MACGPTSKHAQPTRTHSLPASPSAVEEPRFALGEMVVHSRKGFRGVVCGWDLACCESPEWQEAAGVRCAAGCEL